MAFNVEYIYTVIDKFSGPLGRIRRVTDKASASLKKAARAAGEFGKKMKSIGAGMTLKVTAPILLISGFAIKAAADLESMRISFDVMLGSAQKGGKMLEDLKRFSAKTPFQLKGIGQSTKQLLAAGVAQDDIIDRLTVIGDIAAGAGVPINEMAAIFSKARQKGKLMAEEILQFAERGVPLLDVLAKTMGKTKNEIFELASKGKITFDIALKAMRQMTGEGGVFNNMMAKQSATMAGLWSTLKDNMFLAQAGIGQTIIDLFDLKDVLKKLISSVQSFNEKFEKFAKERPALTKLILILTGILAIAGPILVMIGLMAVAFSALAVAVTAVSWPILLISAALLTLLVLFGWLVSKSDSFWDALKIGGLGVVNFLIDAFDALAMAIVDAFLVIPKLILKIVNMLPFIKIPQSLLDTMAFSNMAAARSEQRDDRTSSAIAANAASRKEDNNGFMSGILDVFIRDKDNVERKQVPLNAGANL